MRDVVWLLQFPWKHEWLPKMAHWCSKTLDDR
jgi:hypothetical protein